MSNKDNQQPDVRSIERDLKRGKMTRKEAERLVKGLPDVKDKSVSLEDVAPLESTRDSDSN